MGGTSVACMGVLYDMQELFKLCCHTLHKPQLLHVQQHALQHLPVNSAGIRVVSHYDQYITINRS